MKGKPQITEAQRIADRLGADAVVVIAFGSGQMAGASYGATKRKCKAVGEWMDTVIDAVCKSETLPAPKLNPQDCPWPMIMQDSEGTEGR